jgi:hypothetical protein
VRRAGADQSVATQFRFYEIEAGVLAKGNDNFCSPADGEAYFIDFRETWWLIKDESQRAGCGLAACPKSSVFTLPEKLDKQVALILADGDIALVKQCLPAINHFEKRSPSAQKNSRRGRDLALVACLGAERCWNYYGLGFEIRRQKYLFCRMNG